MKENARLPAAVYLVAAAGGLSVSNLYFSQPLLPMIAESVGASPAAVTYLPALTQAGFACGIIAFLPLADIVELRWLVAIMLVLVSGMVLLHGLAPTLPLLLAAGFALGLVCIVPQLMTPYAALLAPKGLEGRSVGLVLSGILSGVLISKIVAGFVATALGWRALYLMSSAIMLALAVLVVLVLPPNRPAMPQRYDALIRSTIVLFRQEPAIRRHALYGALAFGVFMIFWSNYAVHLAEAFGYGPDMAGLFGLAGIAGIVAASVAGRQIDRGGFNRVCIGSGLIMAMAFLLMMQAEHNVVVLVVGVVLLDAGMALCHSANQSSAFALRPESRGRVNAIYMSGYFIGGAIGTALGSLALERTGWLGLCLTGMVLAASISAIQFFAPIRARVAAGQEQLE